MKGLKDREFEKKKGKTGTIKNGIFSGRSFD